MTRYVPLLLALLAGCLLGWVLRPALEDDYFQATTPTTTSQADNNLRGDRVSDASGADESPGNPRKSPTASFPGFADISAIPDRQQRLLVWLQTILSADAAALAGYLDEAWLQQDDPLLATVVNEALYRLAMLDRSAALAWIRSSPDRQTAWFPVVHAIAERDPEAAWLLLDTATPADRTGISMGLAMVLGAAPLAEVLARAERMGEQSRMFASGLDADWARWAVRADPEAAFADVITLPMDEQVRWKYLHSLLFNWIQKAPLAALDAIGSLEPSQADIPTAHLGSLIIRNHEEVVAWLTTRTEPHLQAMLPTVIGAWANSAPALALNAAERLGASQRQPAVERIMESWAANDWAAAGRWVASHPEYDKHATLTSTVIGNYALHDPAGALQWARSVEGAAANAALKKFIAQVQGPLAAEAAILVKGEEARQAAVTAAFRGWLRLDAQAARDYAEANLQGADRETALEILSPPEDVSRVD